MSQSDTFFMKRALALARRGWGTTHPNPMVGAVIAQGDKIVAQAWHPGAGQAHAEALALAQWQGPPTDDTRLYLTLEPCSTYGHTPPCTEAILRSGIRRIKIAALDPNPRHAGRGIAILRNAGLEVDVGILAEAATDLNLIFNYWITRSRPFIAAKVAVTLDGRTATRTDQAQWITGDCARRDVMRWRRYFPAIAVGAGTILADNPRLTSRRRRVWCPIRFVFDRSLHTVIDPLPHIYSDPYATKTIVVTLNKSQDSDRCRRLEQQGVSVWGFGIEEPETFWENFRLRCAQAGITGVYFEGGSHLLSSLLDTRQIDYLFAYQSPTFFADTQARPLFTGQITRVMDQAYRLATVKHRYLAPDSLTRGFVVYPEAKTQG